MKRYVKTPIYAYYGGYILRKICSIAPYLGLVPKANTLGKKSGVSALVRIRNEPWIEPSLLSIKDFADEIIVVDSSTDDTPEKVRNVVEEHGLNVEYIYKVCDQHEAWQIALRRSVHEWILRWDGDFVAYTSPTKKLKELLTKLSEEKYYYIEFPHVCVDLDFFHIDKYQPYHTEGWIFKYSPVLHDIFEIQGCPKFYEKKFLKNIYAMHLRGVKPPLRLLDAAFEGSWKMEENKEKYSWSFDEYVKARVKSDYGTEDLTKIAQKTLENLEEKVVPYEKEIYGDYPKILKDYVWKKFDMKL
jgi:glycosyltransferase involved in cell wall biosynthesis